jgi:N-6 DNA methylase
MVKCLAFPYPSRRPIASRQPAEPRNLAAGKSRIERALEHRGRLWAFNHDQVVVLALEAGRGKRQSALWRQRASGGAAELLHQNRETAFLFLQHFIKHLKAGGRAAIIIKNTFLSNSDGASRSLRKELLENCNLHTVLDDEHAELVRQDSSLSWDGAGPSGKCRSSLAITRRAIFQQRPESLWFAGRSRCARARPVRLRLVKQAQRRSLRAYAKIVAQALAGALHPR